jgi:hypothetical protein
MGTSQRWHMMEWMEEISSTTPWRAEVLHIAEKYLKKHKENKKKKKYARKEREIRKGERSPSSSLRARVFVF